ncbi:MAG: hypothetical protein AB1679_30840 [Actinomycetota bacterium]|jgi:hypothetical protein
MDERSTSRPARELFVPRVLGAVAVLSAVISAAGFTVLVSPAQSTPEYMSQFNAKYNTRGSKLDSCMTCHTSQAGGAENINPYGADFGKNNHDFGAVEGLDSDGDGFSNIDEIKAETFPGDQNDNPNTKPKEQPKPPPSSTTTTTGPLDAILGLLPKG